MQFYLEKRHLLGTMDFTDIQGGAGQKTSQYPVWPPFASRSATHLLCMELIRLLIVECWSNVASMAVRSCWIFAGTGTCCCICQSRASQTCLMGDMEKLEQKHKCSVYIFVLCKLPQYIEVPMTFLEMCNIFTFVHICKMVEVLVSFELPKFLRVQGKQEIQ